MIGRIDLTKSMVNISMRMKSKRTWGILGKENNGITMQMEKVFDKARQFQVGCRFNVPCRLKFRAFGQGVFKASHLRCSAGDKIWQKKYSLLPINVTAGTNVISLKALSRK